MGPGMMISTLRVLDETDFQCGVFMYNYNCTLVSCISIMIPYV